VYDFIVNIYEFRVTPIGERISKAINFKTGISDSIKIVADHLLDLKNKVDDVMVVREKKWVATRQGLYLHDPTRDSKKGIFHGWAEVGSVGSFDRLRNRKGAVSYSPTNDDLSMREYFYRIEMPPDSSLGFLVVQRHGRNTAAPAIQQTLRRAFNKKDQTAHFRLITDKDAFDEYLNGRVSAVKARYVPQQQDARATIKKSIVLGSHLSRADREDMDIKLKVNRPITKVLKAQIEAWLTSTEAARPQIVTLPVDDDPDRLILCIETDDGRQKQLHPGMIADMALSVDLTATVKPRDLDSANEKASEICANRRAGLTT
jgi:hypothetical protein